MAARVKKPKKVEPEPVMPIPEDPKLNDALLGDIDTMSAQLHDRDLLYVRETYEIVTNPKKNGKVKEGTIIFDPKIHAVPKGDPGNHLAKMRMEDRLWNPGSPHNTVVALHGINLVEAWRVATHLYNSSPLARRIVSIYTFLTIGKRLRVSFTDNRGNPSDRKNEQWRRVRKISQFDRRVKHAVRMSSMLGEWFLFRHGTGKNTQVRHLEPDRVPTIFLNSEDVEDVRGYGWLRHDGEEGIVTPENVIRFRADELGNVPRTPPPLLPVMRWIREFDLFLENRMWINKIRARYPAIRKVKGTAAQVTAEKNRLTRLPAPASVLVDPDGYDWQFPPHQVGASDVEADSRLLLQTISTGSDIPMFLLVPSSDGQNYSNTVTQESPLVANIEDKQERMEEPIIQLICWLMNEQPDRVLLEWPPVVRRGIGELMAAMGVGVQNQFLSRQSAAEASGRQWDGPDGERERIAREQSELMGWGAAGDQPPAVDPFQKKADGGVGDPKTGTSMGAGAPKQQPTPPTV